MTRYLALLRGVNVGGKSLVSMAFLKEALTRADFVDVHTYIQSGNVIFSSDNSNTDQLALDIQACIRRCFGLEVAVVVFSTDDWRYIIEAAPSWWGTDITWKHNLLVMIKPFNMDEVVAAIGQLKPGIEMIEPGDGVLYQSMSRALYGRTTTGKLASNPIYKQMTARNYNTVTKLLGLMG